MRRVFAVDVLECPVCRGAMKIIAEFTDPKVTERFFAAIDLPTEAPQIRRARPPPQLELTLDEQDLDEKADADTSYEWA